MARRVFFSFHYERDAQRAGIVRNSWVTKPGAEDAGFIDAAGWEAVQKKGDAAIKAWIADQMSGTSVTAVLIGAETSGRPWVRYELRESYRKGNGVLGVYLHNIPGFDKKTDTAGNNQFGELTMGSNKESIYFWQLYPSYDWVLDEGYKNLGDWVEQAAKKAGK